MVNLNYTWKCILIYSGNDATCISKEVGNDVYYVCGYHFKPPPGVDTSASPSLLALFLTLPFCFPNGQ